MSSMEAPCEPEVDVDLVERAIKALVSITEFMRIVFNHPDIVEETTGL